MKRLILTTTLMLFGAGVLAGCATMGPRAGKLDLAVVEAHLQSDLKCAGAIGQIFARAGVGTALAAVGLPPNAANQVSQFLAKLTGALDSSPTANTTLSFTETCAVLVANVDQDVDQIKAKIADLKARKAAKAPPKTSWSTPRFRYAPAFWSGSCSGECDPRPCYVALAEDIERVRRLVTRL